MIIYQLLKQKEFLVCNYAFEAFTSTERIILLRDLKFWIEI